MSGGVREIVKRVLKKSREALQVLPDAPPNQTAAAHFRDVAPWSQPKAVVPSQESDRIYDISYHTRDTRRAARSVQLANAKPEESKVEAERIVSPDWLPKHLPTSKWVAEEEKVLAQWNKNGLPPAPGVFVKMHDSKDKDLAYQA